MPRGRIPLAASPGAMAAVMLLSCLLCSCDSAYIAVCDLLCRKGFIWNNKMEEMTTRERVELTIGIVSPTSYANVQANSQINFSGIPVTVYLTEHEYRDTLLHLKPSGSRNFEGNGFGKMLNVDSVSVDCVRNSQTREEALRCFSFSR